MFSAELITVYSRHCVRVVVRKKTGLCGKNSQVADPPHPSPSPPSLGNPCYQKKLFFFFHFRTSGTFLVFTNHNFWVVNVDGECGNIGILWEFFPHDPVFFRKLPNGLVLAKDQNHFGMPIFLSKIKEFGNLSGVKDLTNSTSGSQMPKSLSGRQ